MEQDSFTSAMPGSWVQNIGGHITFMPNPLPRDTTWMGSLLGLLNDSALELGRLQGALQQLDGLHPDLLLRPLIRREATLSSRIEGTLAAEEDLALFEVSDRVEDEVPDVRELRNYARALEWGATEVANTGITPAFVKRLHQMLMTNIRGGDDTPGQFRVKQVLIGGDGTYSRAKFVPAPAVHVGALIDDLTAFMADAKAIPPLVRAAMAHYQFETIHPFKDGNGRVGRLLIAIQVVRDFQMQLPALHMSAYFEADRRSYYDGLLNLSKTGRWADWTEYFLLGVVRQAKDTVDRLGSLRDLRRAYRQKFERARGSVLTAKAIDLLFQQPAVTIRTLADHLGVTNTAAQQHIKRLEDAGILKEATGKTYGRVFIAREIIDLARKSSKLRELPPIFEASNSSQRRL